MLEEPCSLHTPDFDIVEEAMAYGAAFLAACFLDLSEEFLGEPQE